MNEIEVVSGVGPDGQIRVMNESGMPLKEIRGDRAFREMAQQLSRWVDRARAATGRGSMFDRGAYTPPENPYDEMRAARNALKYDDIVSGVADTTEAHALQGVKWESDDPDEADAFNQLAADQNLDAVIRSMYREEFTISQFVAASTWDWREYTVRGKTKNGNQRKRTFKVWAPTEIRTLDHAKIVPIGIGPWAGRRLAWQATLDEINDYKQVIDGTKVDQMVSTFYKGEYHPEGVERVELAQLGVQVDKLLELNQDYVFRHTLTKGDYERFADIRLKSCFKLLDLKQQLINADRAALIGSANYILLIRKGTDEKPATPGEIEHLKENYSFITKLPVIISDHRLTVDIIAPKIDLTLNQEKYDVLDSRLLARLLGTLTIGAKGGAGRSDTTDKISLAVARVMENKRHMLKRTLERQIAKAIVEHPKNKGVFKTEPNLVFLPRSIALSLDSAYAQALLALRTQREISRETILEFFGLDQASEAARLEIEEELYDDIFKTIMLPGAAPVDGEDTKDGANGDPAARPASGQPSDGAKKPTPNGTGEAPSVSGARGGRPKGGGGKAVSTNPTKTAKPRTGNGNPQTGK